MGTDARILARHRHRCHAGAAMAIDDGAPSGRMPWYRWYVADHALVLRSWPPIARLAYRELADAQWVDGVVPADPRELRRLVPGITKRQWDAAWPYIERTFTAHPMSAEARRCAWIDELRSAAISSSDARTRAAKAAANSRWGNDSSE